MTMHEGHRGRMRERFCQEGLDGFAPHEVLELLLFYAKARGDTNSLAHLLLDRFGSLKGVFEARPEQLMSVKGVGRETATLISMIVPMFRRYHQCICAEIKTIARRNDAERYCLATMAGLRRERLYLISLSSSMKVLGRSMLCEGNLIEVPAYPRHVVEAALNHNAHSVILCHNHPGGHAEPSEADIELTVGLEGLLRHLDIQLIDHIIVAGTSTYSMTLHGHLRNMTMRRQSDGKSCCEADQEYVWRPGGELVQK